MTSKQPRGNTPIAMGDGGTFTEGERLIQADVPVETLLGVANGVVTGALVSTAISAAATMAQQGPESLLQNTMRNVFGNHRAFVLAGTAVVAAISGLLRFSRARKHNEWSENHYNFLRDQTRSHVERSQPADKSSEELQR